MAFDVFSLESIKERKAYPFLMAICYSFLSIAAATFIFPENAIIFAIAFTSLLLLPTTARLLKMEKDIESRSEKLAPADFLKEHKDILQMYLLIFLGIVAAFLIFSIMTSRPSMSQMLQNQEDFVFSLYMSPKYLDFGDFFMIFGNNLKVIMVCYLAALFFGTGMIFIVTWNASIWGTIFGTIISNAASLGSNPLLFTLFLSIAILPHLIIEASAYYVSGISGGIIWKAAESDGLRSRKFQIISKKSIMMFWMAMLLVAIGALLESQLAPNIVRLLFG